MHPKSVPALLLQPQQIFRLQLLLGALLLSSTTALAADPLDTWHQRPAPLAIPNAYLSALAFGNGRFVAFTDNNFNRVLTSTNGADWEAHPAPYPNFKSLAFGTTTAAGPVFVAAFGSVSGQPDRLYSSPDGVAWTLRFTAPPDNVTDFRALAVATDKTLAVGSVVWLSPDLANWSASEYGTVGFSAVTFGNGTFAASDGSALWSSPDGVAWTYRAPSSGGSRLVFGNGRFLAVSYPAGHSVVSPDAIAWTQNATANVPPPFNNGPLAFAGGYFICLPTAAGGSDLLVSTNGLDWESHPFGTNWFPNAIAFGNNTFVAVGNSSVILQSDAVIDSPAGPPPTLAIRQAPSLSISGQIGRDYRIEYADTLSGTNNTFLPLTTFHMNVSPTIWVDTTATNAAQRFYRAAMLP